MKLRDLTTIGLSEKEAAVYLTLLELGSDTVQHIAKKSGVNRATTYLILDALRKKGVVSTLVQGKKTYYAAESPESLMRLIRLEETEARERERQLLVLLPELRGIYNRAEHKPVVRFYEGREGIMEIREDILRSAKGEIFNVYGLNVIARIFSDAERKRFSDARIQKKIHIKSIYSGEKKTFRTSGERYHVPESEFDFPADLTIYGDKIALSSLKDHLSGVIIESPTIARTLRSVFALAVEAAKARNK